MSDSTARNNFNQYYERYYPSIVCFIYTYVKDQAKAEDIAQNVFLTLWERRSEIDMSKSVKAFIYTIARNLTLDTLRHQKIKQSFFQEQQQLSVQIEQELNIEALACLNEDKLRQRLRVQKIKSFVMRLPFSDRKIFILSKFNNLTYTEIAEILEISPKTVEKRISLTLKLIRTKITVFIIIG